MKKYVLLCLGCLLLALLFSQSEARQREEALAERLSPSILRFHILADSDRDADQRVKLEVRSLLLDYMQEHFPNLSSKEETIACLTGHRAELEAAADRYLEAQGFPYKAALTVARDYFPTRVYDRLVIPAGYYDAAQVTLGRGRGHNWWCVLYPRLCFVDAVCTDVPEEAEKLLRGDLNRDDYLALQDNRPEIEIRFALFPFLNPRSAPERQSSLASPFTAH